MHTIVLGLVEGRGMHMASVLCMPVYRIAAGTVHLLLVPRKP